MNGLDLFSGIGGISLALREWVRPIAYCEIDPYCQGVLISRMANGLLPNCPIWNDVKSLQGADFRGSIDMVYGGFPCQDISCAGHGKGLEGERSGLFFEIMRLAKEIRPKFIFLENVPTITSRGGFQVVEEITSLWYDCRWCVISAASVGALHRRERWFLLAHAKHDGASTSKDGGSTREELVSGKFKEQAQDSRAFERASCLSSDVANSNDGNTDSIPGEQTNKVAQSEQTEERAWRGSAGQHWPFESREHWQKTVSEMGKCSDGIPFQVDRLRALGNSVCPQQVKEAFKILMGIK